MKKYLTQVLLQPSLTETGWVSSPLIAADNRGFFGAAAQLIISIGYFIGSRSSINSINMLDECPTSHGLLMGFFSSKSNSQLVEELFCYGSCCAGFAIE